MIIDNAGLVILHAYINTYFERLGLVEGHQYKSENAQRIAVHHLQYLVTGAYETEEPYLVLNKLLCGLSPDQPVQRKIDGDSDSEELANGLIHAVISAWPAIGTSSIEGFRGNWLIRQGHLDEQQEYWQLTVESMPYDLLLDQLPIAISTVKLAWMEKPLIVSWRT